MSASNWNKVGGVFFCEEFSRKSYQLEIHLLSVSSGLKMGDKKSVSEQG